MKRTILSLAAALLLVALPAVAQQRINKKNLVVKEWRTDANTNQKMLDHTTTYGPEGRKIEEIEYGSKGQKWRKRYEYGADGRRSKEYVYNEQNRLVAYKTFEYNEFGKKKKQITYNPKGKATSVKLFEYLTENAGN